MVNNCERVFREFDSNIMQNASDILLLFCTLTWPVSLLEAVASMLMVTLLGAISGIEVTKLMFLLQL